jgi:hypothetical protein
MLQHVANSWVAQAVYVAAKLGIADVLAAGPLSAGELAHRLGTDARSTQRLLRMLASVGNFAEGEPATFANTDSSEKLRDDVPGSQRPTVIAMIELGWRAWGDLLGSITTGEAAFPRVHGRSRYDVLDDDPDLSAMFDRSMAGAATVHARAVVDAYDFTRFARIVDVGGGDGTLLGAILRTTAAARGVLFERPNVIDAARARLPADVAARCELVAGDFFTGPLPTGDALVLKAVLHNWSDADATTILARVREALTPGARALVIEALIAPGNAPDFHKLADVHMLVMHGGRERARDEYAALFAAAGLRLDVVTPTAAGGLAVLEAIRA